MVWFIGCFFPGLGCGGVLVGGAVGVDGSCVGVSA